MSRVNSFLGPSQFKEEELSFIDRCIDPSTSSSEPTSVSTPMKARVKRRNYLLFTDILNLQLRHVLQGQK